jgi:hypothetical protein
MQRSLPLVLYRSCIALQILASPSGQQALQDHNSDVVVMSRSMPESVVWRQQGLPGGYDVQVGGLNNPAVL